MNTAPSHAPTPTCFTSTRSLQPLLEARTPHAIAIALAHIVQPLTGARGLRLLWDLASPTTASSEPAERIDAEDLTLLQAALEANTPRFSATHPHHLAVPLPRSRAGLLLHVDSHAGARQLLDQIADPLLVADECLRSVLEIVALQSSLAQLEHSDQVQRALFAISDLAGSDRDMDEVLLGIHAIVGTLMYAENFFIVRLDAEHDLVRFLYFADVEDPPPDDVRMSEREGTLTWYLLRDGKPLHGPTDQLSAQVSGPLRIVGTDSHDWLGVPMLRDGEVHGAIVVQSYEPGIEYSVKDQALLEFVASHILNALERKQGKDDLEERVRLRTLELADANQVLQLEIVERQRAERLQVALFQIAQLATADISQTKFYSRVHAEVGDLLNAENFFIALLSEDGQTLDFPYYVDAYQRGNRSRPLGRGLSEFVLRHGTSLMGTHAQVEALARQGEIDLQITGAPAVCWLGVPLLVADAAIGLVAVQSYDATVVYGPADKELLGFVASQVANSLHRRRAAESLQQAYAQLEQRVQERTQELRTEIGERERIQEQLKHQVMHDALTGLPNRGYLRERLERVLALLKRGPQRQCALLYLDIDRFKVINDSLGHLAGDSFLKEVAQRLVACMREPDLVARLAGDEFAILLEDVPDPDTAARVAQRVLAALGAPLQIAGKSLEPSASIGIAIADTSYQSADEVLRDADIALYRAKALGRKRFELFDASLQKHAIDVLTMEGELRVALQHDQFVPYFQPILRLDDGQVQGYEALIRWSHPTLGLIGPGEFLRIAEDSGHIEAIDWWMFEHSCKLAAEHLQDDRYLTLNVSPLHFRRTDFCKRLLGLLERTGLPPWRLVIEVTEGSLLDDPDGVRDILATLRHEGVGAALDDFGTGYSSLSYLHTFPLRIVKIDRSFVARLGNPGTGNSEAVVASVLALARALDVEALAEGIETEAQRDMLLAMGCRFGQGYLLGRPAPIEHWTPVHSR